MNKLGVTDLGARFPHKVTFHDGCHGLRELGIKKSPRELLGKVRGLELVEMAEAETCCGFGGTFAAKFPMISTAMGEVKCASATETGAEYIVSNDSSCLMHFQGLLSRQGKPLKTIHLAEVLDRKMSAFATRISQAGAGDDGGFAPSQDHPHGAGQLRDRPRPAQGVVSKTGNPRASSPPKRNGKRSIIWTNISSSLSRKWRRAERKFIGRAPAAQAREIILQIVREKKARSIIKSKAMTAEEIHLNDALEQAGLEVVENDLGEFIVQLRHEAPYHIVFPSMHLTRGEISELFPARTGQRADRTIPKN